MGNLLKENEDPDFIKNPYQAIGMARESLKQREETTRMHTEIQKLDDEVNDMKLRNEEEKLIIQDLELALTKRRRKAEKCRRLAEAQSSHRTTLEKMIRDTMHQSVVYKEQVRLNQAASNALMARLDAQRAICDAAEKEFQRKYKQRDEIEKQIRTEWEQRRKRSRIDDITFEERDSKPILCLPEIRPRTPLHKELRMFLEEEQRASEAGLSAYEKQKQEGKQDELKIPAYSNTEEKLEEHDRQLGAFEGEISIEHRMNQQEFCEGKKNYGISFPSLHEAETDEDEESRRQRGKGNVEKWLQMLLENCQEHMDPQETKENETSGTEEIIKQLNQKYPQKEIKLSRNSDSGYKGKQVQISQDNDGWTEKEDWTKNDASKGFMQTGNKNYTEEAWIGEGNGTPSFGGIEKSEQQRKEKRLVKSESARALMRIPSSPSLLLGMRKGVDRSEKKRP